jgi:hypothetical protein
MNMQRTVFFLTILLALSLTINAQDINNIFKGRPEVYFTFKADDIARLNALGSIISIDNVKEDLRVYAYANKKEFTAFLREEIPYKLLLHPGMLHKPRMLDRVDIKDIEDWDFYPTYDAYVDMMYQFEADFPDICDVFSIGTSVEGRELLVARITDNVGQDEAEPEFFYTSTMHGDETTGYVLMLRLIDYLLNGYGENARLTDLVDETDIYINPNANPDGTYYTGNYTVYGAIRYNANGVDLNRNFPDMIDGPYPNQQQETTCFVDFAEERDFTMSCNIHGGTEVCNYPWDRKWERAADDLWWIRVCRQYADTAQEYSPFGYMDGYNNGITNGYDWYSISGGRQDYMNYFQQCREFTLEISNVKLLPANQLPDLWEYNYRSLLNYMEQSLYGLRGIVTDSLTGDPLDAEVYVMGHEKDSSWVYASLPGGNYHRYLFSSLYSVRFRKPGYTNRTFNGIQVKNDEATVFDVKLFNPFNAVPDTEVQLFRVFPNPASGNYIKIKADGPITGVRIITLGGALCREYGTSGPAGEYIDISSLAPGIYFIEANVAGKTARQKLVVR